MIEVKIPYECIPASTVSGKYRELKKEYSRIIDIAQKFGGKPRDFKPGHATICFFDFEDESAWANFEIEISSRDYIDELLTQRRIMLAAHSYIYYEMGDTVIPDYIWDNKAKELAFYQRIHMGYGSDSYREKLQRI